MSKDDTPPTLAAGARAKLLDGWQFAVKQPKHKRYGSGKQVHSITQGKSDSEIVVCLVDGDFVSLRASRLEALPTSHADTGKYKLKVKGKNLAGHF